MERRKGLCTTCIHVPTCIFVNRLPVLQCEEFSSGNHVPAFKQAKKKRAVLREEASESE